MSDTTTRHTEGSMKTIDRSVASIKALKFLSQDQDWNHCGPTSASASLAGLGIAVRPRDIVTSGGARPWQVVLGGFGEAQIIAAIRALGATAHIVWAHKKGKKAGKPATCETFVDTVMGHVLQGNTAVVCIEDFSHWVAVVGTLDGDLVVMDPVKDKAFYVWDRKKLEKQTHAKGDDAGDTHLAVLVKRPDGPSPFRLTPEMIALGNADGMSSGKRLERLADITHRILSRAGVKSDRATMTEWPSLRDWLANHEEHILEPSEDVFKSDIRECSKADVRRRFRSFLRFASVLPVRIPADANVQASLTASFTTEMVDCALNNSDDVLSEGE